MRELGVIRPSNNPLHMFPVDCVSVSNAINVTKSNQHSVQFLKDIQCQVYAERRFYPRLTGCTSPSPNYGWTCWNSKDSSHRPIRSPVCLSNVPQTHQWSYARFRFLLWNHLISWSYKYTLLSQLQLIPLQIATRLDQRYTSREIMVIRAKGKHNFTLKMSSL